MNKQARIATALLLLTVFPTLAFAQAVPQPQDKYLVHHCAVTPEVTPIDEYPGRGNIVPSNKLALPAGKAVYPDGQLVFLAGRVLDENCVPISDAIVDIWQTDPNGHYIHATLADRLSPYPYFTGSGRATTDNLGRYNFVTLFPGTYGNSAPHIHFHVIHKDFSTLDTEIYFQDDRRNSHDSKLSRLPAASRALVTAKTWQRNPRNLDDGLNAQWDITLRGVNLYRRF
jgi:protocatechuate 3,4-dioxygenase beta subunit